MLQKASSRAAVGATDSGAGVVGQDCDEIGGDFGGAGAGGAGKARLRVRPAQQVPGAGVGVGEPAWRRHPLTKVACGRRPRSSPALGAAEALPGAWGSDADSGDGGGLDYDYG